ncbi:hypothetical protein IFM89_033909 [Coptis chinensis]|uniref:DRBM domain-containing protein n=1 Tax=Coptis chinensis TaxID=261450 RepID=A0A835HX35_9MAGN|nr:hypothetical protein IFM89_033909 [Coptis chinensis]
MYKNQLQELAQRSCFNLPSYACIREGPDHAPRFKASVNFNGEVFEGPSYCTTLRQAEHAAAEVALSSLSTRGPSRLLAARVLDEIGVYKNLLQETAHRAGLDLPVYITERSGPGHLPVFTSIVELAGLNFTGEPARTKKQAEKNAAMAAWSALKQMSIVGSTSQTKKETESSEEQEHLVVARVLSKFSAKRENRTLRHRNQSQVRKRLILDHRVLQHQQWRTMGLSSDSSSSCSIQQRTALLPRALSTSSKILPPSSSTDESNYSSLCSPNKGIPVQVKSNSLAMKQDIAPPLEEHQKDEDEWLCKKAIITEKPTGKDPNNANPNSVFRQQPKYLSPFNSSFLDHTQQNIHPRPYRPATSMGIRTNGSNATTSQRMLNSGGFHVHNIAPAVHIRSVIPVCATPPMRPPSSNSPIAPQKKQDLIPSVSDTVLKQAEQEVPTASSKLNSLHL